MANNKPPDSKESKLILAAGAVAWRPGRDGGEPEVLLVHRKKYDDWSLPKGKTEPGEPLPLTAVREVFEEGGARLILGRRLTSVRYQVGGRPKRVHWWAARVSGMDEAAVPNTEVDEVTWAVQPHAGERASYEHDVRVLGDFASAACRHGAAHPAAARHGGAPLEVEGRRRRAAAGQQRPRRGEAARAAARGLRPARPGDQLRGHPLPGQRRSVRGTDRRAGAGRAGAAGPVIRNGPGRLRGPHRRDHRRGRARGGLRAPRERAPAAGRGHRGAGAARRDAPAGGMGR